MKLLKLKMPMVGVLLIFGVATSGWCSMFNQEMFGLENGIVHPYASLTAEYTDNLFSTQGGEKDDFLTMITPGVWLAFPGADAEVINIASSSSAAGGMAQTRFQQGDTGRFQTFFKYAPTFETYAVTDQRDIVTHQVDGYAALNLRGGLSFELMDQYQDNRDSVTDDTDSAEYNNNLMGLTTSYEVTEKLKARVDLRYFDVNYDSIKPEKDREDLAVTGYVFFAVMPKTSLFGEITHVDIDYDTLDPIYGNKDSTELKLYAGVKYDASDRMNAMLKVGFMDKERDADSDSKSSLSYEGTLWYDVSDRVDLNASSSLMNRESIIGVYATVTKFSVTGTYDATQRVDASLMLFVSDEAYEKEDRDDSTYTISPSVRYALNNKIYANLAWSLSERDSTGGANNVSDYTRNSIILTLSGSL